MNKTCYHCNNEFNTTDSRSKFCSRSCAGSYNGLRRKHSEDTKQKISNKQKEKKSLKIMECVVCGSKYQHKRYRKTCSTACFIINKSELSKFAWRRGCFKNSDLGGIREGSTRGKSGRYRGIYCDSTYELAFVIYNLDHGNDIQRYGKYFNYYDPDRNGWFKYYPDFLVNGQIIEIKNYFRNIDTYKLSGTNGTVIIKYKNDLQEIFEYLEKKTGLHRNRFFELYDDVVIQRKECENKCGCIFDVIDTRKKFCSKRCARIFSVNMKKFDSSIV